MFRDSLPKYGLLALAIVGLPLPLAADEAVSAAAVAEPAPTTAVASDTAAEPAAEDAQADVAPTPKPLIEIAGFRINGRFDLDYEVSGFNGLPKDITKNDSLKNYHHFLFVSRKNQQEDFSMAVEVIDLAFFDLAYRFGRPGTLHAGKIFVPFGAEPPFHKLYGGLNGQDQSFLPFLWAEYGAQWDTLIYKKKSIRLDSNSYIVAGIAGKAGEMLSLSAGGDAQKPAAGQRLRFAYGSYSSWASVYWSRYDRGQDLLMYGLDGYAARGFVPFLPGLSLKAGFLRADIRSQRTLGDYYHFADYLEVAYSLPKGFSLVARTGTITMDNNDGLFWDKTRRSQNDTVNYSGTAWWHTSYLSVGLEYLARIEKLDEQKNDLLRLLTILEF